MLYKIHIPYQDLSYFSVMQLNILDLKPYRKIHTPLTSILAVIVAITILFVKLVDGFSFFIFFMRQISGYVMAAAIGLTFVSAFKQSSMQKKVRASESFDEKAELHFQLYRFSIIWSFVSGILSSIMFICTERNWWLFFCVFDVLMLLTQKPRSKRFSIELQTEQIEYVN
jgi:hypothetical protein